MAMSGALFANGDEQDPRQLRENTYLSDTTRAGSRSNHHDSNQHRQALWGNGGLPGRRRHSNLRETVEVHSPFLLLHRVVCDRRRVDGEDHQDHPQSTDFLDPPRLFAGDTRASALRGQQPFYYDDELLPGICMMVHRTYNCVSHHQQVKDTFEFESSKVHRQVLNRMRPYFFTLRETSPPATLVSEGINFTSETLSQAMNIATDSYEFALADWNVDRRLRAPYDYFYHFRRDLREKSVSRLVGIEQYEFNVLLDYIDKTQGEYFDAVDASFAAGFVERQTFSKLFRPDDLIVTSEDGHPRAYIAERINILDAQNIQLDCRAWSFDGSFRRKSSSISVQWSTRDSNQIAIESLAAWPLRLDRTDLQRRLERRGQDFWSCRHRRFVSYTAPTKGIFELQTV